MSNFNQSKKSKVFQNLESLKSVENVLGEASEALNDVTRTIETSAIPEVLVGAVGVGTGAGLSFAALYLGGSVVGLSAAGITSGLAAAGSIIGGGMVAGIAVLAAPAVILGAGGVGVASFIRNKKLFEKKHYLYMEAVKKQNAIIRQLETEVNIGSERRQYLEALNILLQSAIKDLSRDLGLE